MKKKDQKTMYWVIGIALILVFIIGGNQGWFKSSSLTINNPPPQTIAPSQNTPTLSSCSALCTQESFANFKTSTSTDGSDCDVGSTFYKYGFPGQPTLLNCCCWNTQTPTSTCVDSDGDNRDTAGHVTYANDQYYDECLSVGHGVKEYICQYNRAVSKNYACDIGETCVQTRSGGHCVTSAPTWHPGDTVFSGTGTGTLTSTNEFASLDLSEYGITTDGNCQLGAQIQTSWSYANPNDCVGIPGTTGVKWDFYDSNGLEYSRLDQTPIGLGIDLHPTEHYLEWDGSTAWKGMVSKVPNIMPQCVINYEYSARIYIYSCS